MWSSGDSRSNRPGSTSLFFWVYLAASSSSSMADETASGLLPRQEVSCAGDNAPRDASGERAPVRQANPRAGLAMPSSAPYKTIAGTVNFRTGGKLALDGFEARLAGGVEIPVAVGVDDAVHEIRIVERLRRLVVRVVREMPGGRPHLPQQLAQRTAIGGQPGPSALGVEVPLIPERRLRLPAPPASAAKTRPESSSRR